MTKWKTVKTISFEEFMDEFSKPVPWYKRCYYNLLDIFSGIKGLIWTIKHIWKNRWLLKHIVRFRPYDYSFLYLLMGDAFEKMEHLFRHHGSGVNALKDAKSLQICKNACRRLAGDEPIDKLYDGSIAEQEKYFSTKHIFNQNPSNVHKDILLAELKRKGFYWD